MKRLAILFGAAAVVALLALPSPVLPTAAPAPAPQNAPEVDKDGDGYNEAQEQAIFGVPGRDRLRCGTDSWPSDVMSAYGQEPDSQNRVTIQDVGSFVLPVRRLDTSPGDPNFSRRWDLNPGPNGTANWINISDLVALSSSASGRSAYPSMFGGQRAWHGPYCSASVPFFKKATTPFDTYAKDPASWAGIANARYRGTLMYPPASDTHHAWYRGEDPNEGFFYKNAGGIEIGGSPVPGVSVAHALRDAEGNPCYLPFPSGGPFTRYLADVGDQGYRDLVTAYIVRKTETYSQYIGPYLDDVDLRIAYASCGDHYPADNNSSPVDPRTGQVMDAGDWQMYWVEFLQQIRNALPRSAKIVHNAPWYFLPIGDPEHEAQVRAADYVEMEFGWNEVDSITGHYGWNAKMAYVDWVHSLGANVISQEYDGDQPFTQQQIIYGLANYFLFTNGQDYFALFDDADPDDDWTRYGSTLGEPLGSRYQSGGMWRRDFEFGYVTVDPAAKIGAIVAP